MSNKDISSFLSRKQGSGDKYNYELKPLIENFSFLNFIYNALKNGSVGNDFGAFLVITNKQYVLGYNAGFGYGTHIASFARTICDLNGVATINDDREAIRLSGKCKEDYITARIMYDCVGQNENCRPIYSGSISFSIDKLPISANQFEVFKKFYETYNKEIELVVKKCTIDKFCVWYAYRGGDGELLVNKSSNLDNLYKFLETNIDYNKTVDDNDEKIIGVSINDSISRKI